VICWAITTVAADEVGELKEKLSTLTTLTWVYVAAHFVIVVVKVVMFFMYKQKASKVDSDKNLYDVIEEPNKAGYAKANAGKNEPKQTSNSYDTIHESL
jgi:hypothetical protein